MGKFIGIIAAALERRDGEFVQTTDLLDFPAEVWVYYCRPHLGPPKPGWADLAAGTLRVSLTPPPYRNDQIEWQPSVTPDGATGAFEYRAEAFGVEPGNNVFHLALPPDSLPVPNSWDIPPLYGHVDGGRFVLGWEIQWNNQTYNNIWPTFRFEPAESERFATRAEDIGRAIERETRRRRQEVFQPVAQVSALDRPTLHRKLDAHLDEEETRTLVFELGIDYDNLSGRTKKSKLRELILFMQRQNQLPNLIFHLQTNYPLVLGE